MGTDINVRIEVRVTTPGSDYAYWTIVGDPSDYLGRGYSFFGEWFGVRTEGTGAFADRGFPHDNTFVSMNSNFRGGAYESPTWLSVDEAEFIERDDEPCIKGWDWLCEDARHFARRHGKENVRLLIWFDS